jgi:hypothetical protein
MHRRDDEPPCRGGGEADNQCKNRRRLQRWLKPQPDTADYEQRQHQPVADTPSIMRNGNSLMNQFDAANAYMVD